MSQNDGDKGPVDDIQEEEKVEVKDWHILSLLSAVCQFVNLSFTFSFFLSLSLSLPLFLLLFFFLSFFLFLALSSLFCAL